MQSDRRNLPLRTALYLRVSTEEQAKEGYSLQSQKRRLLAYCDANNWVVSAIYCDEGISGSTLEKRPQALQMLNDLKESKFDNILILKVDRLCRNTRNLLEVVDLCKKHNVMLNAIEESIDYSTPTGKMMLTMLGSFAELERSTITSRMMSGKEQKVRNGIHPRTNRPPYGMHWVNDKLVPNELSSVVIDMYDLMVNKRYSFNKVATEFNKLGIPTSYGNGRWNDTKIARILRNPVYAGFTHWKDELIKANNVEPIFTLEQWKELQKVVANTHERLMQRKLPYETFWFGKVLYCSYCGRKMHAAHDYRRKYYQCTASKLAHQVDHPKSKYCNQKLVEAEFIKYLSSFDYSCCVPVLPTKTKPLDVTAYNQKIDHKIERLLELYLNDAITSEQYQSKVAELNALRKEQPQVTEQPLSESKIAELTELARDVVSVWNSMDDFNKRKMVDTLIKRIEFDGDTITRIEFYE